MKQKLKINLLFFLLVFSITISFASEKTSAGITEDTIPDYANAAYTVVNNNMPEFSDTDKTRTDAFETYSELDSLGRCGTAYANICTALMPNAPRGDISDVHPSGWRSGMKWERCHLIGFQLAGENANEKNLITGTHYLNVTGMLPFENMIADYVKETNNHVLYRVTPVFKDQNAIASGVQMEAYSVEDNGDGICFNVFAHNVTPGYQIDYKGGGVAKGNNKINQYIQNGTYTKSVSESKLQKSGYGFKIGCKSPGKTRYKKLSGSSRLSVTTKGKVSVKKGTPAGTYTMRVQISAGAAGIYRAKNIKKTVKLVVQPAKSGSSASDSSSNNADSSTSDTGSNDDQISDSGSTNATGNYIVNTNTGKFHIPSCRSVSQMSEKNKMPTTKTREQLIAEGYSPCGNCKP